MRALIFAERNLKEIVRDLLSVIFCIAFPIGLFFVLELIVSSIPEEGLAQVPQFKINNLSSSIAVFGFSFITLFSGMLISKDRTTSFQARLNSSPLKSSEFILGYTLPLLPIAIIQAIIVFVCSLLFGLEFNGRLLLAIIGLMPAALLFIGLGLLIGSVFNDKSVGGISSIIVNMAAILGGMFFPLETMSGAIVTIANIFPFVHAIKISSNALNGNYSGMIKPLIIVLAYTIVIFVVAIYAFNKKMKNEKK